MLLKIPIASGSIAAYQMLADMTATNAFVAPVGVDLSAYQTGKYIFAAYNTVGGYAAFGYIKGTAPGGDTRTDVINGATANGNMETGDPPTGWNPADTAVVTREADERTGGAGSFSIGVVKGTYNYACARYVTVVVGGLYYREGWIKSPSGGSPSIRWSIDDLAWVTASGTAWTNGSNYKTVTVGTTVSVSLYTGGITTKYLCDDIIIQRVTDCAATGALIVSAKDGATRAWASIDPLFNPNLACRWEIFKIIESNPIVEASATTLWVKTPMYVNLIEWVDDNGDIVHDSTLVLNINGVPLTVKVQPLADVLGHGAVVWRMGPFNPGIPISDFTITTMATGNLHVWLD